MINLNITVEPRLSGIDCQLKKGVGLSTVHVQSHMAAIFADYAKFLFCLNSLQTLQQTKIARGALYQLL